MVLYELGTEIIIGTIGPPAVLDQPIVDAACVCVCVCLCLCLCLCLCVRIYVLSSLSVPSDPHPMTLMACIPNSFPVDGVFVSAEGCTTCPLSRCPPHAPRNTPDLTHVDTRRKNIAGSPQKPWGGAMVYPCPMRPRPTACCPRWWWWCWRWWWWWWWWCWRWVGGVG